MTYFTSAPAIEKLFTAVAGQTQRQESEIEK